MVSGLKGAYDFETFNQKTKEKKMQLAEQQRTNLNTSNFSMDFGGAGPSITEINRNQSISEISAISRRQTDVQETIAPARGVAEQ
jgi:hypothetical protein